MTLKRLSDAALVLALVLLVVGLVGPSWVLGVAAALLVAAVGLTVAKRRRGRARRPA